MAYAQGMVPITVGMSEDLLRQVDERASRVGMSRAEWLRKVAAWALTQPITSVDRKEQM